MANDTSGVPRVRIDVVSDVVCPWCYIGKRHLEAALALRPDVKVDVHWRAFQLNPEMPSNGMARDEYLRAKFGDAAGGDIYERISNVGKQAGIAFDFAAIGRTPNTVSAHRLIAAIDSARPDPITADNALQDAVVESLFEGYFMGGADIGDWGVLSDIARRAGLSDELIEQLTDTDAYRAEVVAEDQIARGSGISGVPCFIIDQSFAVNGAQPPDALAAALDHALNKQTTTLAAGRPAPKS